MSLAMQVELYNYFMWVNYQIFKKKKSKMKKNVHCIWGSRLQIIKGHIFLLQHFQNLPFNR